MVDHERASATAAPSTAAPWWGEHALDVGQSLVCTVGPLTLTLARLEDEWRASFVRGEESATAVSGVALVAGVPEVADALDRYLVRATTRTCRLSPVLADRPVISRPEKPFHVPSGEAATLYLSSPVSVRVEAGDEPRALFDVPSVELSETWFGPSTLEGELCLASRTLGRIRLADVPLRTHRAVTPVAIENHGPGHLSIERLSLPVTNLSVFSCSGGALWTESVTLVREEDGDLARLLIEDGPPQPGTQLAEPRTRRTDGGLARALGQLFA